MAEITKPIVLDETVKELVQIFRDIGIIKGKDGHTPVKGEDYFTDSEIEEFKSAVTPKKGVDYFDGEKGDPFTYEDFTPEQLEALKGQDGRTPAKGEDYYTEADKAEMVQEVLNAMPGSGGSVTAENIATALGYVPVNPENMPTKTSQLTNDSGFMTNEQLPIHLPNPNKLTFTGAVQGEYDGSEPLSVEIPTGGSGGNSEWRKVAELKTEEDLTYISVTEDMEGNPLSFDEAIVICSSARPTDATATGNLTISPSPEWRSSFMCWGISGFQLYGDVYTGGVHFKKLNDYVLMQVVMNRRTASNLAVLPNKFELFENNITGATLSNGNMISAGIKSRYCKGTNNSLILDLFNDENKMRGITVGVDMATSVKIGAGSTLEVWVK